MTKVQKKELVARAATEREEIIDYLDSTLGPNGQAWLVCSFTECTHVIRGHCDIYTVSDAPRLRPGQPCDRYEPRPPVHGDMIGNG